jgi:hypothetical protein
MTILSYSQRAKKYFSNNKRQEARIFSLSTAKNHQMKNSETVSRLNHNGNYDLLIPVLPF